MSETKRRTKILMLKTLQAITVLLLIAAIGLLLTQEQPPANTASLDQVSQAIERLEENRVETMIYAKQSSVMVNSATSALGTGVIVRSDVNGKLYVWTAAHVVDAHWTRRQRITVQQMHVLKFRLAGDAEGHSGFTSSVKLIAIGTYGQDDDLALLEIEENQSVFGLHTVVFSDRQPEIGDRVFHVGNFLGRPFPLTISRGIVGNQFPSGRVGVYDVATIQVKEGASGGGVFLEESGDVVGIVSAKASKEGTAPVYYVPMRRIKEFAKKHGVEYAVPLRATTDVSAQNSDTH